MHRLMWLGRFCRDACPELCASRGPLCPAWALDRDPCPCDPCPCDLDRSALPWAEPIPRADVAC
eukprot:9383398-Pyramimonas_sp.AAC.1